MAKFFGSVGYSETKEDAPGVWNEVTVEKPYRGEILKNSRRWESKEKVNDDLVVNNMISIVADAYAYQNFFFIKYVCWMGTKWKVTNAEVQRPRIILTLGGIYNGA